MHQQLQSWPTPQIFIPYLAIDMNGWSPILAAVSDGERRVLQVIDWTGGGGSKPALGLYIGPAGLVSDIAAAVGVRGKAGPEGQQRTVFGEVLEGVRDGINKEFTIPSSPKDGSAVYQNGLRLMEGVDYTRVGFTITFEQAPMATDLLQADYA